MNKLLHSDKGFVSIVALMFLALVLAFVGSSLLVINNYLMTIKNINDFNNDSVVETYAIKYAQYLWDEYAEEDYCEFYDEYEICYEFDYLDGKITIENHNGFKTIKLEYDDSYYAIKKISIKYEEYY